MSFWYEPKAEDIQLSDDGKELEIYLGQDASGAVYATVRVSDVQAALTKLPNGQ